MRTRRLGWKFPRRSSLETDFNFCQQEDLPGKLIPRATLLRGCMIETVAITTAQADNLARQVDRRRRTHKLILHHPHPTALSRQLKHQIYKVASALRPAGMLSVQGRGTEHEMFWIQRSGVVLARQFRVSVHLQGKWRIVLGIGRALLSIKDIVCTYVIKSRPEVARGYREVPRTHRVVCICIFRLLLAVIHVMHRCGVHYDFRIALRQASPYRAELTHFNVSMGQRTNAIVPFSKRIGHVAAELPICADDRDVHCAPAMAGASTLSSNSLNVRMFE